MKKRQPVEGRWYWVKTTSGNWFPSFRRALSEGGWTNLDTWEDWDHEIVDWMIIALPRKTGK